MVQHLKEWWRSRRLDNQPTPEEDPIVNSSFAVPLAISSLLLLLSLIWAFYEEAWGLRPWRPIQAEFAEAYPEALRNLRPKRAAEEEAIRNSEGYQNLRARLEAAEQVAAGKLRELQDEKSQVLARLKAITPVFTTARSEIQATRYSVETGGASMEELEELKQRPHQVQMPDGPVTYVFEEMEEEFNSLKTKQGQLQTREVEIRREPNQLQRELDDYVKDRMSGLTAAQVDTLIEAAQNIDISIRQIHNAEMNLVDRCESCHLAIREPVTLTPDDVGNELFVTHPQKELLQIHDPEVFGCSPCHNGNGVGTVSVRRAHGKYKHWLWPLYAEENFEAGCLQCHEQDRQLAFADTLNKGKDLFQHRGCQGCHPREGYDPEPKELREVRKNIADLTENRQAEQLRIERLVRQGDQAETNEAANRFYDEAQRATMGIANLDTELDRQRARAKELLLEVKTVGPNLKEVRVKLRKEWIPVWIRNPQAFRPSTKMPQFRLSDEDVEAIAAFIWQSGIDAPPPVHPAGDPVRGKGLFEVRGCMACHSVGEGEEALGGDFAANLSRVGEKANYGYLVRWVHNPKERTLPYCPVHQRDITPQDYASQGLPFAFGPDSDMCPLGDHALQVQNQILMPSLRLSDQDARDIASYLMTLRREDDEYPAAPFMDDPALFEKGRFLVRHFGCAGCHEIAGLEIEGKIGTDLTVEGSKPIERLDFALLTHEAKKEGWYNHKGFFENKLREPSIYDDGKIKQPLERLRMPNFHLSEEEIDPLVTFLLGSVETLIPAQFHDVPGDQRADVKAGWWVVKKYNCQGCHEFTPGQETDLQSLPRYQGEGKEKLPPSLVGEGARVDPDWLARFLKNPALSETDLNRNGVRPYLDIRMPTFSLSDGEVQKLVRFFQALSSEPLPYLRPPLDALSQRELVMARELFTSRAAPCLRCHATGDPVTDPTKTAPNFALISQRLKPAWTERWLVHPEIIRPGTAMPSGLFRWDGSRWVFALADLPSLRGYPRDHAELVVRYMFEFTPEEQRRLTR